MRLTSRHGPWMQVPELQTRPSQGNCRAVCGTEGLRVLLREGEGVCRSGRQVAGMRVAGDLACACPGQLGQAAVPCLCSPVLAFSLPRLLLFPSCFFFSPSFHLAFSSSLRHVRAPQL